MNCERCKSKMTYNTIEEVFNEASLLVDYWLCLFCGYEVMTAEQIKINDARWSNARVNQ